MLPVSPGSDSGSLVFDDSISSDGLPSPDEPVRLQLAARTRIPYDGAKGVASAGLDLHSPAPLFVGTPFTSGPTPLFEYPFPAPSTRPSLSNASSLSSVSSLMGPPSPSTRTKLRPYVRLAGRNSSQPIPRRFSSGNNPPPIRVPPRLRTDSTSSVGSSLIDEPSATVTRTTPVSAPGPSNNAAGNSPPIPVRSSPLQRLRDRSGSVGIHPIQLPPPILTSVHTIGQTNNSTEALLSPTLVLESMTLSGLGSTLRMTSDSDEGTRPDLDRRRASIPALFAFGERHEDTQEEVEMETPTSYTREKERDSEGDAGDLGIMSINSTT